MKLKPHKWTHHHTHRLYHASMLIGFFMVLCVVVAGQFLVWLNAEADTLPELRVAALTATVGSITPEPPVLGNGGSYFPPTTIEYPPLDIEPAKDITITIEPATSSAKETTVIKNGQEIKVWSFPTQFPAFKGTSSIHNTTVLIEIKSQNNTIRGTAYPNNQGQWTWEPPQALEQGDWEIFASVSDPLNPKRFNQANLVFKIELDSDVIPIPPPSQTSTSPSSSGSSGYIPPTKIPKGLGPKSVLIKVPTDYSKVKPGQPLVVAVKLTNFASPSKPNKVNVGYVIRDSLGNTILESTDIIDSVGDDTYLKNFNTAVNIVGGSYIVSAIVIGDDNTVYSSSDSFAVTPEPLSILATKNFPTPTQALAIIFSVFSVLAYFELHKIAELTHKIRKLHPEFN